MITDELIAAVEAAEGREWNLNERIANTLWGEPRPSGNPGEPKILHWWHNGLGMAVPPDFTGSLDAAMTLADGLFVRMERFSDGWYVSVSPRADDIRKFSCTQKPAAIALCAATLRARKASQPGKQ